MHAWDQGLESLALRRARSAADINGFIHPVVRVGRSGQDRVRRLCQIMQMPPIRTGTLCRRSTSDEARRQSCGRQRRWLAAVPWSSSAARPMPSGCSRQSTASASRWRLHRASPARRRRRHGRSGRDCPSRRTGSVAASARSERRQCASF